LIVLTSSVVGSVIFYPDIQQLSFLKFFIMYSVFLLPIVFDMRDKLYGYVFIFTFVLTAFSFLIPDVSELSLFHATENNNMRFRGFFAEASHLAASLLSLGLISIIFYRKSPLVVIFVIAVLACVFSFVVSSKGILISITLSLIIYLLTKFKLTLRGLVYVSKIMFITFAIVYFVVLPEMFRYIEFETLVSFSTRLIGAVAGVLSIFIYPLGVGFIGFNEALLTIYSQIVDFKYFSDLNFTEINLYINGYSDHISTKNFFSDWLVMFGVPGLFFLYYYLKRVWLSSVNTDPLLSFSFITLLSMLFVFVNSTTLYHLPFLLGVIISHAQKR